MNPDPQPQRSEQQSFRDAGYRGDKFKPSWGEQPPATDDRTDGDLARERIAEIGCIASRPLRPIPATDDKQEQQHENTNAGDSPERFEYLIKELERSHKAALAAEREKHSEEIGQLFDVARKWEDMSLSAQAAIAEHNKEQYPAFRAIDVDLSALERHDAELNRQIAEVEAHNIRGTISPQALHKHDAEVLKPLVDAIKQVLESGDLGNAEYATLENALSNVKSDARTDRASVET